MTYLVIGSTTKLNAFPPLLLLVPFPVLAWSSVPPALAPPLATERFDILVSGALVGGVGIPPPAPIPAIPAPAPTPAFELVSLPFRLGRFLLSSFSLLSSPLESFPWSNFEMLNRSMDIPRPCLLGLPLLLLGVDIVLAAGLSATGDWRGVVGAGTGTSLLITRSAGGVGREVRLSLVGLYVVDSVGSVAALRTGVCKVEGPTDARAAVEGKAWSCGTCAGSGLGIGGTGVAACEIRGPLDSLLDREGLSAFCMTTSSSSCRLFPVVLLGAGGIASSCSLPSSYSNWIVCLNPPGGGRPPLLLEPAPFFSR